MSLTVHAHMEQRTDQWYAARCGLLTASAVGKLLTVMPPDPMGYDCPECSGVAGGSCMSLARGRTDEPIKTLHPARAGLAAEHTATDYRVGLAQTDAARSLVASLAAERITGHVDETFVTLDMMRGVEDEPYAVDAYSQSLAPVTPCGFMVREVDGVRIGYSPDGLVGADGLIEVKSRRQPRHLLTVVDGEVPAENMAQMQCGLLVSGRAWIDYVSYCGGMRLWVKRVWPDERWQAAIVAAAVEAEAQIVAMTDQYEAATAGMPMTDRISHEIEVV